jgi:hypothetical protein
MKQNKDKLLQVRITPTMYEELKAHSDEELTMSNIVRIAIKEYLERKEEEQCQVFQIKEQ